MTPLKFRAWHKKLSKMVLLDEARICQEYSELAFGSSSEEYGGIGRLPGSYCRDNDNQHNLDVDCQNMDNWAIMQSTGLHDKNGKEIFEGDVVSYGAPYIHEVKIRESCGCCATIRGFDIGMEEGEIIGNVWQNPELLPRAA